LIYDETARTEVHAELAGGVALASAAILPARA
jgi:hypothetical protein